MNKLCKLGIHLVVEEGGGAMGNALRCLLCGRNKYPEVFGIAVIKIPIEVCRNLEKAGKQYENS